MAYDGQVKTRNEYEREQNSIISDTPLTDAIASAKYDFPYQYTKEITYHAREMEREVNQLRKRIANLESIVKEARPVPRARRELERRRVCQAMTS